MIHYVCSRQGISQCYDGFNLTGFQVNFLGPKNRWFRGQLQLLFSYLNLLQKSLRFVRPVRFRHILSLIYLNKYYVELDLKKLFN